MMFSKSRAFIAVTAIFVWSCHDVIVLCVDSSQGADTKSQIADTTSQIADTTSDVADMSHGSDNNNTTSPPLPAPVMPGRFWSVLDMLARFVGLPNNFTTTHYYGNGHNETDGNSTQLPLSTPPWIRPLEKLHHPQKQQKHQRQNKQHNDDQHIREQTLHQEQRQQQQQKEQQKQQQEQQEEEQQQKEQKEEQQKQQQKQEEEEEEKEEEQQQKEEQKQQQKQQEQQKEEQQKQQEEEQEQQNDDEQDSPHTPNQSIPQNRQQQQQQHQNPYRRRPSYLPTLAPECESSPCQPPDCTCPSYSHPGNFSLDQVPMMIMLTFDDAVTSENFRYFERIMRQNFRNPNGCPMKMTFFVCNDGGNDYRLTRNLYDEGHEIASHSLSHRYPESWWRYASSTDYAREFVGQRIRLSKRAGIPEHRVRGMRVPFLSLNGDSVMEVAQNHDFSYDSSCVGANSPDRRHPPVWPYTLDFTPPEEACEQEGRPTRTYPGVWEVPLTKYSCEGNDGNYMLDECQGHLGEGRTKDVSDFLWRQFSRHYPTRAPMGLFTHAFFFRQERKALRGLIRFLRQMTSRKDVWLVSAGQVVDWMKHPTPISALHQFEPWKC